MHSQCDFMHSMVCFIWQLLNEFCVTYSMPVVHFTQNLRRHIAVPSEKVVGDTVRAALDAVFALNPSAQSYILDDQSAIRKHVTIFINGEPINDRTQLTDPVKPDDEIYIMQALSGG